MGTFAESPALDLLREAGIAAELVSWYAFRAYTKPKHPPVREDDGEEAAAAAAAAALRGPRRLLLDSVGIFSLQKMHKVESRDMSLWHWEHPESLPEWVKDAGAGCPHHVVLGRIQEAPRVADPTPPAGAAEARSRPRGSRKRDADQGTEGQGEAH